jgi:hypothetical protein
MTAEQLAADVERRCNLGRLHIFDCPGGWRVFGSRKTPQGYQASVEEGFGPTILAAIQSLDERLAMGPIKASAQKLARSRMEGVTHGE